MAIDCLGLVKTHFFPAGGHIIVKLGATESYYNDDAYRSKHITLSGG